HVAKVAQLAEAQPLELLGRGTRLRRRADALLLLAGLDQRADHERLSAGAQILGDPLVGSRALASARHHVRRGRASPERTLLQARLVEVPVLAQRGRARN